MDSEAHLPSRSLKITHLLAITLVVVAVALLTRLWGLSSEPAWLDEVYSVLMSEGSVDQILEVNARDVHPPAYYLGLGIWRDQLGSTPAGIRSYSLLWSLVGVVFVVLLAAASGLDWRGTALAGLLVAINPLDIFFAQEARMYAQAAAFGAASSWMLWRWLISRDEPTSKLAQGMWLALYACTAALLLQTLYLGAFVLLAQGLFVLVYSSTRRDFSGILGYTGTSLASALLFLPWLAYMRTHGPHKLGRLDWISAPSLGDLLSPFYREFFIGRVIPSAISFQVLLTLSAVASITVLLSVVQGWRREDSRTRVSIYLAWMTCVPLGLAFLVSHLFRPVYFSARFPVLVLPTFLVLIAVAAMLMRRKWLRLGFVFLALSLMTTGSALQRRQITKPGMARFAEMYQRLGPPDHVVLLPPDRTITASYQLGFPLVNSNQQQIQSSLEREQETVIWVGVKKGYLETADPRVRRVYDWLLSLGPTEQLGTVDRLEMWQVTARQEPLSHEENQSSEIP